MLELPQKYQEIDEVFNDLGEGILVVYQCGSGSFFMLKNLVDSYRKGSTKFNNSNPNIFAINEAHPLYKDFNKFYGIPNKTAVLIIKEGKIKEVLYGPFSKTKLMISILALEH